MPKIFTWIIIVSLVIQIGFSFYYSNDILNQNIQLNQYQNQVKQIKLDLELIEKNMADLSSINNISVSSSSAVIPINQTIKIFSR